MLGTEKVVRGRADRIYWYCNELQETIRDTCCLGMAFAKSAVTDDQSERGVMPEPATLTLISTGFIAMGVRYLGKRYRQVKPWFDRIVASLVLFMLTPVIGLCAVLMKLTSRGPAFYSQDRVGKDGKIFRMMKIRTMRDGAESLTGPIWATENDSRVTRVGRLLRRTHLDELPQLVNVVRGEMSLVGPRPERPQIVDQLKGKVPGYEQRLAVRPGITGLAQVRAGYDRTLNDVRRKLKLDMMYIRRMCWWVDFGIIVKTVRKLF